MKFADTSFLVALLNPKDQWHALAKTAAEQLDEPVLTSMWVLVELGDALSVGETVRSFYVSSIAWANNLNGKQSPPHPRGFGAESNCFGRAPTRSGR